MFEILCINFFYITIIKSNYVFLDLDDTWVEVSSKCNLPIQIGNVPLCLPLLAKINLIAAERMDFSLTGNSKTKFEIKFELLKFPGSFRASVSQVALCTQRLFRS